MTQLASAAEASVADVDSLRGPRLRSLLLALAIGFGLVAFLMAFGDVAKSFDFSELLRVVRRLPAPDDLPRLR